MYEIINRGEMFQRADKRMTNYKKDMDKDYRFTLLSPKTSYLLFVYKSGTHMIKFHKIKDLPAKGERIPYFFGQADRWHIVTEWKNRVNDIARNNEWLHYDIYYFNGEKIYADLDIEEAIKIVEYKITKRFEEFHLQEIVS